MVSFDYIILVIRYCHVIEFSDLIDVCVIKIKSLWSFAHIVCQQDQVNRARNTERCKKFVYFIVKVTRLYDYQTWQKHYIWEIREMRIRFVGFFLNWAFRVLIGWAGKLWLRGVHKKINCKNLPCHFPKIQSHSEQLLWTICSEPERSEKNGLYWSEIHT